MILKIDTFGNWNLGAAIPLNLLIGLISRDQ